jgi:hypothetical protein
LTAHTNTHTKTAPFFIFRGSFIYFCFLFFVVFVVDSRRWALTTVEFVAGFWAVNVAVASPLHRNAWPVLARELSLRTLGPFFIIVPWHTHDTVDGSPSYVQ